MKSYIMINDKLERTYREVDAIYCIHLPVGTEQNHETPQSSWPPFQNSNLLHSPPTAMLPLLTVDKN
jgi:hypothetical protein